MKRTVLLILALVLMFSVLNITAFGANKESENNDDYSKADQLSVNEAVTGTIANDKDVDWYKFTLSKAGYISVKLDHQVIPTTSGYWKLALYKSDGTTDVIGETTVWTVKGNEALVTCYIGLEKGTYYVKVMPYSSYYYETTEYKLTVSFRASDAWETEDNTTYAKADMLTLNKEYSGTISSDSDADWYHFKLTSDGVADISFTHTVKADTSNYWKLYLYKSDGTTGINGDETMWLIRGNENLSTCKLGLKKGDYYIKIVPHSSYYVDSGTYRLKVGFEQSDSWEKENNSSFSAPTALTLDTEIYGTICNDRDIDWYRLSLEKAGKVTFSFTHPINESSSNLWHIWIYSSNGTDGITGSDCDEYISGSYDCVFPPVSLGAGTYYIKISAYSSYNWSSDVYTLKASFEEEAYSELEPNGDITKATAITTGTEYIGSLFNYDDVDYYRFTLDSSSDVTVVFRRKNENETRVDVVVYENDGTTYVGNAYEFKGNASVSSINYGTLPKGTYYIKLQPYSSYYNALEPYGIAVLVNHEHTYGGTWEINYEPGCTYEGEKQNHCTVCGAVCKETIPATGHTFGDWVTGYESGCETEGYRYHECIICGSSEGESTPPLGHSYGEWKVTKKPTCSKEGIESSVCDVCGESKTRSIKKLEHTYGEPELVEGSIFSYPMIYRKECLDCGHYEDFEDNKYRWAAPAIIGGGIALILLLVILLVVKLRKNAKAYASSAYPNQNTYQQPYAQNYNPLPPANVQQSNIPVPPANVQQNNIPVPPANVQQSNIPVPPVAPAVPAAVRFDPNGNVICSCGKVNGPDAKFCYGCGKKLK